MAEQQNQLLDQAHLDDDVTRAEQHEIGQEQRHPAFARQPRAQQERRQQQCNESGDRTHREQGKQRGQREIHFEVRALVIE